MGGNAKIQMYKVSPCCRAGRPACMHPVGSPPPWTACAGFAVQGVSGAYAIITSSYLIVAVAGALLLCAPHAPNCCHNADTGHQCVGFTWLIAPAQPQARMRGFPSMA